MNELFHTYLIPIIIALTIGVVVGIWLFRARRGATIARQSPLDRPPLDRAPLDPSPPPAGDAKVRGTHPLGDPLEARPAPVPEAAIPPAPAPERKPAAPAPKPAKKAPAANRDGPEGNGLIDQGAAAATDVAGSVLGVKAHGELPGADGPPDNLQMLKGVGPKMAAKLNEHGITRFAHIARLSEAELARLDEDMGAFRGRLARDRVLEQADYLARDDRDAFEAKFGKLGGAA